MDSVPPCDEPCSLPGQSTFPTDSPFHRRKPLPTLPKVFQRPGSKRCREKKKAPKRILSSRLCPSLVSGCSAMLHADQPPDSGGDFRPDLKKSFFRDGESTRGEGAVFTKNAPSPLAIIFLCLPATAGESWHPPGPRWLPRRARLQGCGSAGGSAGLPAPGGWCSAG